MSHIEAPHGTSPERATPGPASRGRVDPNSPVRRWQAFCLFLFLVSVGLAALAVTFASAMNRTDSDREAVAEVAAEFTTALLTYDSQSLEASKAKILTLITPGYRKTYEENYEGLRLVLTQTKASSKTEVTAVYVGPIDGSKASAITVADSVSSTTGGVRTVKGSHIRISLEKVDGQWRVASVTNVNSGEQSDAQPTTTAARRP